MATNKRFAVAGVSTLNGDTKLRFANDVMRIKILQKNGHKDINLVELPREMTKSEAIAHLREIGFGKGNSVIESVMFHVEKKNPAAVKPAKTAKAKSAKASVTSNEDAPF